MAGDDFKALAAQLRDLQDATKAQIAGVMARAEEAGLDPAGLRRFVSWKRKNEEKRAQQEAIDQQCRYLAGERDAPAQLPIGCELAVALNLYRRNMTVRQVAEEMNVSVGKAGKLRQMSRMFAVHVHATVDSRPPHDPATGEITEPYCSETEVYIEKFTSAASHGRADDASVTPPADVVPPTANPQMEGVAPPSVTPAPSARIEVGTIHEAATEESAGEAAGNAGGSHDERRLTLEPEVARVAPPVPISDDPGPMPAFLRRERVSA